MKGVNPQQVYKGERAPASSLAGNTFKLRESPKAFAHQAALGNRRRGHANHMGTVTAAKDANNGRSAAKPYGRRAGLPPRFA